MARTIRIAVWAKDPAWQKWLAGMSEGIPKPPPKKESARARKANADPGALARRISTLGSR